jgi:nitrogen fixation protein FixH
MPMILFMGVVVGMFVAVLISMFVVMGAYACRSFSGQPASAIFTHQSISKEATSISRPARSSPLRQ